MRTVVIASRKGGVGKSTLCAHLAVEALHAGPVAIADTDPQGSLADWWNAREAEAPAFATLEDVQHIAPHLASLESQGIQHLFVDTAPGISDTVRLAIAAADFVLVPCRPSPHDLRAVGQTLSLVEDAGKPFAFVINAAVSRSTIETDTLRALAQHGRVAPVVLHHRIDFATSMIDGRSVQELNSKSRSAHEVRELWIYVNTQMSKQARTS
jgi:chromosome partitioning protein